MMQIAVLSDTHIPGNCPGLPQELLERLKPADLIIHAGDFTEPFVIDELKKIAPLECVSGNMDAHVIKRQFPDKKVIELENFKIGIVHGCGAPDNIINYARGAFIGENLNCIIHGHSHLPKIEYIDDMIVFCPGSPTDRIFAPYNSFGWLEISDKINPKIIRL
jgi:uncharacterized protein